MEQYLNRSDSIKVEIETLESLLGPEDFEVHLSNWNWIVLSRGHQLFVSFTATPETHQR